MTGKTDSHTKAIMSKPRCAMPDIDPLGASKYGPWTRRDLTFCFGNVVGGVNQANIKDAVRRAFRAWADAGVGLQFREVDQTSPADIQVEWRPANDPDHNMKGSLIAHSDFPPGFSLIVSHPPLPLHFNEEEDKWIDGAAPDQYDVQTVSLHEIGHCLGLQHSSDSDAVMYPIIPANTERRILQSDDLTQLRSLYPIPTSSSH
jgi:hypothetical protein